MAGRASLRMVPGNMDRMCLPGLEVEEMGQNGVTLGLSSVVVGKGQWAWEHHFPMLSNLLLLQGWPLSSCGLPFIFFPTGVDRGSGS